MANAFYFDGTRCTGCKTCVFACKDKKDLGVGQTYRRVFEYTGGDTTVDDDGCFSTNTFSYYVSVACNHCNDPACAKVCPTGAMHRDEETGLVLVNAETCIGCGYCHMACPYNAPYVDREIGHSVKCDGCYDLLMEGEKPACVMGCPARVLDFGTPEEMSELGEQLNIDPMPQASYTHPNMYITPSQDARPAGSLEGVIGNPLEVQ